MLIKYEYIRNLQILCGWFQVDDYRSYTMDYNPGETVCDVLYNQTFLFPFFP